MKVKHGKLLSSFAFSFNLRRYNKAVQTPMINVAGGMAGNFSYMEVALGGAPAGVRFVIREARGESATTQCSIDEPSPFPSRCRHEHAH